MSDDSKYGWGRLLTEQAVIEACEKLGAVDLSPPPKPPEPKAGFAPPQPVIGGGAAKPM